MARSGIQWGMETPVLTRSLLVDAARAVGYGALALVDPNRVRGLGKGAYWAALSGATAAETALVPEVDRRESIPWGITAASLVLAGKGLYERSDAWLVGKLEGWGVRRPRWWLAGATVASVLALGWVERRFTHAHDEEWVDPHDLTGDASDLPENVRALLTAMLDAVDGYDVDRLRAQLDVTCGGSVGDPAAIGLVVDDEDLPTTLLDNFMWPVTVTFERGGLTHEVMLEILDGRLWRLAQYVAEGEVDIETHDWSWPMIDEVTIAPGSRVW